MDSLIVAVSRDSLTSIRRYVTTAAAAADLEKKAASQLCRAVDELPMRAIVQGHAGADDKDVWRVRAHLEQKSLTIILKARGEPYGPYQNLALPASDASLEDGLNHPLHGVDEFRY